MCAVRLPLFENLLWGFGAALKVLLSVFVYQRRVYRRLPVFTAYATLLLVELAAVWFAYRYWGYRSRPAAYIYWGVLGDVLAARGGVVAELCFASLGKYRGLWFVVRSFLLATAALMIVWATLAAFANLHPFRAFVLATEQGLELATSVILIALYILTIRYRAWLEPLERNLLLGLAIYSVFETLNRTFMSHFMAYFPWWESLRIGVFDFAMCLWLGALWKFRPASASPVPMISEQISIGLLQRVLVRMQDLKHSVQRLGKAAWKQ